MLFSTHAQPAATWRRAGVIAAGAALVCALLLAPLLHFVAGEDWASSILWASAAGIGCGGLIALIWLTDRIAAALLAKIPFRKVRRRKTGVEAAAARAQVAATLDAIETELKRIGYWQADPPDLLALCDSGEIKSYLDAPSFELWLQCVFLPRARTMLQNDQLPASSSVGVIAMRQYDYHSYVEEAQPLLRLLSAFDAQVNAYVGHDPLNG
jgi:uncharacterized protein YqcC (DUF446 family)